MLHEREIQILNILSGSEEAMTSADIVEAGNRLSQSTVQVVLRKMLGQGFIETHEVKYSGNVLSRAYRPTDKVKSEAAQQVADYVSQMGNIIGVEKAKQIEDILLK